MTPTELGGVMLTVDGLSALVASGVVAGVTLGILVVAVTLFYGRSR